MPAKYVHRVDDGGSYCHIHNRGVEKRIIFNDDKDYEVFLGYLKQYLTPPDPESAKKVFTVKGRSFQGIPHQPQNYFNKVVLIAYSLMPNHFHLVLHQVTKNSIGRFMKSLSTRYSTYFNKKYQHTGAVFAGPYKSVQIRDGSQLLHLTRFLYQTGNHSSLEEYLGKRETSWVKPKIVLSLLKEKNYKNFVEKYWLDQKEKELLRGILIEDEAEHLERRNLARNADVELPKEIHFDPDLEPQSNVPFPAMAIAVAVFVLLFGLGLRNMASPIKANKYKPTPVPSPTPLAIVEAKPKTTLTVKVTDGSASVNIRQAPTVRSTKVGEAKDGDTFEFVSAGEGWYEIKLTDGSTGFISARYVEVINNQSP